MTALGDLKEILGPRGFLGNPEEMAPFVTDWRGRVTGQAAAIALPKTTAEVAGVVKICAHAGIAMVPQGGNTGLVQGGVPGPSGKEVVINLGRMNKILEINPEENSARVEAGVVLAALQDAAAKKDRLFPLSLGAEGTCQVGGNIATNAGGIHVLRYGPMRDLVFGLEVVLPDGEVWDGLTVLHKDNTGYDLKQLFIGAEGTLGIITAATVKLFPAPKTRETAILAAPDPASLLQILTVLQGRFGERLSAFEIFPEPALKMVLKHITGTRHPIPGQHPWFAVIDLWDVAVNPGLADDLEAALGTLLEKGLASDAVVARSLQQAGDFWKLREAIAEAQKKDGDGIKHDISVPISKIPEFIARADTAVEEIVPGFKRVAFGHAGDGNIHYDPCPPKGMDQESFLGFRREVNRAVHDIVADLGGSISAEHGIGTTRRAELHHYKSAVEMRLYQTLKAALDPNGLMNPGKII